MKLNEHFANAAKEAGMGEVEENSLKRLNVEVLCRAMVKECTKIFRGNGTLTDKQVVEMINNHFGI